MLLHGYRVNTQSVSTIQIVPIIFGYLLFLKKITGKFEQAYENLCFILIKRMFAGRVCLIGWFNFNLACWPLCMPPPRLFLFLCHSAINSRRGSRHQLKSACLISFVLLILLSKKMNCLVARYVLLSLPFYYCYWNSAVHFCTLIFLSW